MLPRTLDELLLHATQVFGTEVKRILNSSGDVILSIDVVRDGDVLVAAGEEPFIPGKENDISILWTR